jgi:hypothetical protein
MEKFSIKQGLKVTVFLIGYFLIMELLGLGGNIWLRFLNAFILFGGVFVAIRGWKKRNGGVPYFHGIAVGMLTTFTAAFLFSIFIIGYLTYDVALMQEINSMKIFRHEFTPVKAGGVIFFEALFSGYLFSYTSLQILKNSIDTEQSMDNYNPAAR